MTCRKITNQSGFTLIEIIATVVIVSIFSAIMLNLFSDSFIKSSDALRNIFRSNDLSKVMANINSDYIPYPKWKASTSYAAGNKVLPTGMNGRFYICKTGGTSGPSEPKWYDSADTLDGTGTLTWTAGVWVKQTPYSVGDIVIPTSPNGHFYRCITAGTSGTTEPTTWILTGHAPITDGIAGSAVTWERLLGYLNQQVGTPDTNSPKNNSYGQYYVLENRFVTFVSNAIQTTSAKENVLEVKIQSVEKNPDGTYSPGEQVLTALFTANEN